jgi:hypothetical protein
VQGSDTAHLEGDCLIAPFSAVLLQAARGRSLGSPAGSEVPIRPDYEAADATSRKSRRRGSNPFGTLRVMIDNDHGVAWLL